MQKAVDGYFFEVAAQISRDMGDVLDVASVRWVREPDPDGVKDATFAVYVDGLSHEDDVVVLVSSEAFPEAVGDDIAHANVVADLLNEDTAAHVIRPRSVGRWGAQTYAAFPRLQPMSANRVYGYAQKVNFAPKIGAWLADVAQKTKRNYWRDDDYAKHFVEPLRVISDDPEFSAEVREAATGYLDFVTEERRALFTVVEHGDLWRGNVFFKRRTGVGRGTLMGDFYVIDWRGSKADGYPGADILRYCQSLFGNGGPRPAAVLQDYADRVGLSPVEMGLYCTLSLGRQGQNLDQFPRERYYPLVEDQFAYLQANVLGDAPVAKLTAQAPVYSGDAADGSRRSN